MKAYISAWQQPNVAHCLIIEEINRGNCAAIFGDLFQLLDRANDGFSQYHIEADAEQQKYLAQALAESKYSNNFVSVYTNRNEKTPENLYSILMLPSNLSILATMNTSDQSLYPMDSAFKRRWDWAYCPIDYAKAAEYSIVIGEKTYNWGDFLRAVNEKVYALTQSEDKQIGTFFVKPKDNLISEADFLNKVLFYLWNDVLKDENPQGEHFFFKIDKTPFTFNDMFKAGRTADCLSAIFSNLSVGME
jgi:5-methylcytosine-specific restriction endonuclease McrBC GTP-binding regulatory subunit McrB